MRAAAAQRLPAGRSGWVGVAGQRRPKASRSCHFKHTVCLQHQQSFMQPSQITLLPRAARHAATAPAQKNACAPNPSHSMDSPVPCSSDGAQKQSW